MEIWIVKGLFWMCLLLDRFIVRWRRGERTRQGGMLFVISAPIVSPSPPWVWRRPRSRNDKDMSKVKPVTHYHKKINTPNYLAEYLEGEGDFLLRWSFTSEPWFFKKKKKSQNKPFLCYSTPYNLGFASVRKILVKYRGFIEKFSLFSNRSEALSSLSHPPNCKTFFMRKIWINPKSVSKQIPKPWWNLKLHLKGEFKNSRSQHHSTT